MSEKVLRTELYNGEEVSLALHNENIRVSLLGSQSTVKFLGRFTNTNGSFYVTNQRIIFESEAEGPGFFSSQRDYTIPLMDVKSFETSGDRLLFVIMEDSYTSSWLETMHPDEPYKNAYIFGVPSNSKVKAKLDSIHGVPKAKHHEKLLEFDQASEIYKKLKMDEEVIRVRKQKANLAAPKTEIHGDYVDDRDTIVKDSVVNRSNVGSSGKSKAEEIKEIKELLDSGAIDDDEFKQMKKEILGK